jgi:hypothetical protein
VSLRLLYLIFVRVCGWLVLLATLDLGHPARGDAHGLDKPSLGETALLALLGEPLPSLPGGQGLAAPLGFFGAADALDVGVAIPLGVTGHGLLRRWSCRRRPGGCTGVLDKLALLGDGCAQEERVQRGTVEASPA